MLQLIVNVTLLVLCSWCTPSCLQIWEAKLQGDRSLSRCTHALLPAGSEDRGKGKVEERQATRVTFALAGEVCFGEWVQLSCFALLWAWDSCNVDDVIEYPGVL